MEQLRKFFFTDVTEALGDENADILTKLTAGNAIRTGGALVVEMGLLCDNCSFETGVFHELLQLVKDAQQSQARGQIGESVTIDISTLWIEKLMLTNSGDLSALTSVVADPNSTVRHLKIEDLLARVSERTDDMKGAF